ncbi:response regulator transcription factor [Cohnella boryungensis]|uniref:Response regulator n=1 Tax=Cohnella boryungensis TaxID=768479 RepID=A0ABV8SEQ6_9BACL
MIPITVMLVDDEPLALENVYEMVAWEANGFEIVAKAGNGRMALRLFDKHRPQIVITDISMPQMDGLELGRAIHRQSPETQLVYLTAYRDFDYARQALELKAASYLLKHEISRNRLLEHLLELRRTIQGQAHLRESAVRTLIGDYLRGKSVLRIEEADSPLTRELTERLRVSLALLLFEINPVVHLDGGKSTVQTADERLWERLSREVRDNLNTVRTIEVLPTDGGGYAVLLSVNAPNSMLLMQYRLQQIARIFQKGIAEATGFAPSILMEPCSSKEQLPELFGAMTEAYDYSLFLPASSLFMLTQVPTGKSDSRAFLPDLMEASDFRSLLGFLKTTGAELAKEYGVEGNKPLGGNARDIAAALRRMQEERAEEKRLRSSFSRWVLKAMDYVGEHYGDSDLSLESVAESLQISAIHLRTTFKKETGQSLLDYTTEFRMEIAKRLLKSGELKIYEVSEKVGYKTSQYFSQVFKKVTGSHPKDFIGREGEG